MASRAAAKKKKKICVRKKSSHSAVIKSPGRWTGNNIFLKGGLMCFISILTFQPSQFSGQSNQDVLKSLNTFFVARII